MTDYEQYSKEDFGRTSWNDYGETLEELREKVENYLEENDLEVDVVVPILRAGNFPGTYLAYKLDVLRILPVQYKYFFDEEAEKARLKKILGLDAEKLDDDATILLVEGDHCFGTTANTAAKEIKEKLPESTIIYAADRADYSYQVNKYADAMFCGATTNETRELGQEEAEEKGVMTGTNLYPWENAEEEWKTLQAEEYEYQDIDAAEGQAVDKVELDISNPEEYTEQLEHLEE